MPSGTTQLSAIGFDADDTLWQNEQFYRLTEKRFTALLAEYAEPDHLSHRLLEAERRNLDAYGFGVKGFTLSMIETAIEVTEGRVPASAIRELVDAGRDLLGHPIEPLPHARATLQQLSNEYRLILITKGDLFDQERKLAQSGLGELFAAIEIVSDKSAAVYERVFERHGDGPERGMMVGNSLRSDIVPALKAGCWGVYVPHSLTWAVEQDEAPAGHQRYRHIAHLGELLDIVRQIG
jgi:putative hydrolase of the HAD superfamily